MTPLPPYAYALLILWSLQLYYFDKACREPKPMIYHWENWTGK